MSKRGITRRDFIKTAGTGIIVSKSLLYRSLYGNTSSQNYLDPQEQTGFQGRLPYVGEIVPLSFTPEEFKLKKIPEPYGEQKLSGFKFPNAKGPKINRNNGLVYRDTRKDDIIFAELGSGTAFNITAPIKDMFKKVSNGKETRLNIRNYFSVSDSGVTFTADLLTSSLKSEELRAKEEYEKAKREFLRELKAKEEYEKAKREGLGQRIYIQEYVSTIQHPSPKFVFNVNVYPSYFTTLRTKGRVPEEFDTDENFLVYTDLGNESKYHEIFCISLTSPAQEVAVSKKLSGAKINPYISEGKLVFVNEQTDIVNEQPDVDILEGWIDIYFLDLKCLGTSLKSSRCEPLKVTEKPGFYSYPLIEKDNIVYLGSTSNTDEKLFSRKIGGPEEKQFNLKETIKGSIGRPSMSGGLVAFKASTFEESIGKSQSAIYVVDVEGEGKPLLIKKGISASPDICNRRITFSHENVGYLLDF